MKQQRGFAVMNKELVREIASQGGLAAHRLGRAHKFTSEEAKIAGARGGQKVSQDREHMKEIGRIGGIKTSQDKTHMSAMGKLGQVAFRARHGG